LAQLAAEHGVHPCQLIKWRDTLARLDIRLA
jgi:hypothetical protein